MDILPHMWHEAEIREQGSKQQLVDSALKKPGEIVVICDDGFFKVDATIIDPNTAKVTVTRKNMKVRIGNIAKDGSFAGSYGKGVLVPPVSVSTYQISRESIFIEATRPRSGDRVLRWTPDSK